MTFRAESYVYVLFRPEGQPCYVGKGCGSRWNIHIRQESHNPHLASIIKNAGGDLPRLKIREGLTDQQAIEVEIAFIKAIGREGLGGPLVNLTDGGDGAAGTKVLEKTRQKLIAARENRAPEAEQIRREKIRQALLGREVPQETKAKMKAFWASMTEDQRRLFKAHVSAGIGNKKLSPEHKVKIAEGLRRHHASAAK